MRGTECRRPLYLGLHEKGLLRERAEALEMLLRACCLCPRECGVNRLEGRLGFCGVAAGAKVASLAVHPWEEPPISGTRGSGTIFFSGCTLRCRFCQNFPISRLGVGRSLSVEELAAGMLDLQKKGVHNLNLVTSTHQMPAFVRALLLAVPRGLNLPIVYNTSGYERLETLRLLDGIVDIYLPDIKYSRLEDAVFCSEAPDYPERNRAALLEMHRQVGDLQLDDSGLAWRGMMVRHLVLPEDLSGTEEGLRFLVSALGPSVWVSLMNQYFPAHEAWNHPPLDRKILPQEYEAALQVLDRLNLVNGYVQECCESDDLYVESETPAASPAMNCLKPRNDKVFA